MIDDTTKVDAKRGRAVVNIDGFELTVIEKEGLLIVSQVKIPPRRRGLLTREYLDMLCSAAVRKAVEALADARKGGQLSLKFKF